MAANRQGPVWVIMGAAILLLAALFALPRAETKPNSGSDAPGPRTPPQTLAEASAKGEAATPPRPQGPGAGNKEEQAAAGLEAVLHGPSDRYLHSEVLEVRQNRPDPQGNFQRLRIVRSDENRRYPLLRVEDRVRDEAQAGHSEGSRLLSQSAMVADQVLVRLRSGVSRADLEQLNKDLGATIERKLLAPDTYLVRLAAATLDSIPKAIETYLGAAKHVAYAEPNYIAYALETIPNDTRFGELWGLHNTGQSGGTADADIDAPEAWDITTGSSSTRVGVIDTGIDYNHPDLVPNLWSNPGETGLDSLGRDKRTNGVDDDGNGFIDDHRGWDFANDDNDPMDGHFHGTHVSGTIGGKGNNGQGVTGVCWKVTLVPIKFLSDSGSGTYADGVDSIYYATKMGCHLTSNSWGGGYGAQSMEAAIADAGARGVLFVAAAGNDTRDTELRPNFPSGYNSQNIIAVAATDRNDALAYFSNYGSTSVDLGAPGVATLSTFPTYMTPTMTQNNLPINYASISGTSMATPHVAGLCALLKSLAPGLSPQEIKALLLAGVDPIPALAGRCVTGGRLNAFKAMLQAKNLVMALKTKALDDDGAGGTNGNNDGIANPSERIGLRLTLRNNGPQPATGVTATLGLAVPNSNVTLVQATSSFGNIPLAGEVTGATQYLVQIAPAAPTPLELSFRLTILDSGGNSWTTDFVQGVYTSSQVSGRVVRATGNAPLAGASVTYTGPLSGSATTAADGSYSFKAINGTYMLIAKASGLQDSAPRTVATPPSATNVDLALGVCDIGISPASLSATAEEGALGTATAQIANQGDASLSFKATVPAATATMTGLWHESSRRAHSGTTSWYYGIEGQGNYETGAANSGALGFGPLDVPGASPYLSYWECRDCESRTGFDQSLVQVSTNGGGTWTTLKQSTLYSSGLWISGSVSLAAYAGQRIHLRFFFNTVDPQANYYEGWYIDDVSLYSGALSWLSVAPPSGSVLPGASTALTANFNAAFLDAGTYSSTILVSSNDPDEALLQIPASFTVTPAPRFSGYTPVQMNEDASAPSAGDGDGSAEPGERIELFVTLRNSGHAAATGLTGTLTTTDANATFVSNSTSFANTAAGGSVTNTTPFVVQLSATTPNYSYIHFTLLVRDAAGRQWTLGFTQNIYWNLKLTGVVTDLGTGLPITGATVSVGGRSALTNASGVYLVNYLSPGTFTATASKTGYPSASASISFPPDQSRNFQLGVPNTNQAPLANAQNVVTAEDTAKTIVLSATDANGDALTYAVIAMPAHGTLSGTAPNLTYTPAANYNGPDSFTFKANDGKSDSNTATVSISVTPVNDLPVASSLGVTTAEDIAKPIVLSATDADGESLTYAVVAVPAHGTLSGTAPNLTYTPATNYNGPDSFTFKAHDGKADSNTATVSITVTPVNDAPTLLSPPTATPNPARTGQLVNFSAAASDADGDLLIYGWTFGDGTSATGSTPSHSFALPGSYTATVTASDGKGGSVSGSVVVSVTPADTAGPVLDTTVAVLKGTVSDPSGVASLRVNGALVTVNADGTWQGQVPLTNTTTTVTLTATDTAGNATIRTVTIGR